MAGRRDDADGTVREHILNQVGINKTALATDRDTDIAVSGEGPQLGSLLFVGFLTVSLV